MHVLISAGPRLNGDFLVVTFQQLHLCEPLYHHVLGVNLLVHIISYFTTIWDTFISLHNGSRFPREASDQGILGVVCASSGINLKTKLKMVLH